MTNLVTLVPAGVVSSLFLLRQRVRVEVGCDELEQRWREVRQTRSGADEIGHVRVRREFEQGWLPRGAQRGWR